MKSKILILCSLLTILFTMFACGRHCNGFPIELTNYLPYKHGQIINFVNEHNDTLSVQVADNWKTKPYEIKLGCKCECVANYGFNLSVILNVDYCQSIRCSIELLENNYPHLFLTFFPISSNIIIGITEETDTISVLNQDASVAISNIEIVRGKGITSFTDKNLNCTWQLSEN